jgi:hypothetical protein
MSLFEEIEETDKTVKKTEQEIEWQNMPEFNQKKQETSCATIIFRFETEDDLAQFSKLIGQNLTKKTKSAWFPFRSHWGAAKKEWRDEP